MTSFASFIYAGGMVPYGTAAAPVDPAEKVKPEAPLQRDQISVGYPWLGYDKAPPASDEVFLRMRKHPTSELAFAITTVPIFAGTRTATIRNADGTAGVPSGAPTGIGAQVTATPEEKRKKLLDDLFEDQWADVLVGLECLCFGRWTQEVIWDRKAGVVAPVRFKSFLPQEIQIQRDKFNDFAGYKHGQIERDARYAFHAVCRPQFDPIFGMPRAESARESWWRSIQCHENGDAIEKKASGIQMAIGIMTGMTFKDAITGAVVTGEESVRKVKNAATSGATWTYPLLAFDKATVTQNPKLAEVPAMKIDQFDWGDTGAALVASIARLDRLDKEMIRAWCRPEREAMEGEHGTKAEAGIHGAIGTLDSEKLHGDFLRQFNRQVVNRLLVTNFGPDAADTIYFKAAPLDDTNRQFNQEVLTSLLSSPTAGPQLQANIDTRQLMKKTETPLLPEDMVPVVAPMPAEPPVGNDGQDEEELALSADAGKWVTISGVHVQIDKDGQITKGPKGFVGKDVSDIEKDGSEDIRVTEKMVDVSDLKKTEEEQDEARVNRIAESYEGNPDDIDWSEQPAIIVDEDMNILDGHHRIVAAEKVGITKWRALVVRRKDWDRLLKDEGHTKAIRSIAEAADDDVTFGSAE